MIHFEVGKTILLGRQEGRTGQREDAFSRIDGGSQFPWNWHEPLWSNSPFILATIVLRNRIQIHPLFSLLAGNSFQNQYAQPRLGLKSGNLSRPTKKKTIPGTLFAKSHPRHQDHGTNLGLG